MQSNIITFLFYTHRFVQSVFVYGVPCTCPIVSVRSDNIWYTAENSHEHLYMLYIIYSCRRTHVHTDFRVYYCCYTVIRVYNILLYYMHACCYHNTKIRINKLKRNGLLLSKPMADRVETVDACT